jgi:hypothetical protein
MTTHSPESVIAVFEKRPYVGPELQRQFARSSVLVRECRSIGELLPLVADFDSALLVIDFDSAIESCLRWLYANAESNLRRWPIVGCGSAAVADLEWRLREAGVTAFLPDVVSGDRLARLCRKQLGFTHRLCE